MDRDPQQKALERKVEAEKPAENGGRLHRQVQELRDAGAPLAQTSNTAEKHLPALEISAATGMTLPLKAGEGPYGALQRQHPEWQHKRLLEEAQRIRKETGHSAFKQSERFYFREDGSVTSRIEKNGSYYETTSKDGKVSEKKNHVEDGRGGYTDTVENKDGDRKVYIADRSGLKSSADRQAGAEKKAAKAPEKGQGDSTPGTKPETKSGSAEQKILEQTGKPDPARKDWTVAVELAATMPGDRDNPEGFGADNKLHYLKQLAAESQGSAAVAPGQPGSVGTGIRRQYR
jgi:hypothetical protein